MIPKITKIYYIKFFGSGKLLVVFHVRVNLLLFKSHFIGCYTLLDVLGVEFLQSALEVFVFCKTHFLQQHSMLDIVNVQILRLTPSKQVVSACWVLKAFYIFWALVVVCRYLAEIASAPLNLWINYSDQLTGLNIPNVNLSFHRCCCTLFFVWVNCNHSDLWTVFKRLHIQFTGKHLMDL
jgi:hypothetical protein